LQQPPRHPKWKDTTLSINVAGLERFKPAQDWLDKAQPAAPQPGKKSVAKTPASALPVAAVKAEPAAKVSTPPTTAPQPTVAAPVAKKPAPRPRLVAAPAPPEKGPEMLGLVSRGVGLFLILILIVAFWKVFEKAGEAGWKSLIPIYNLFVLLQMAGCPGWWLLMFFLPVINIYFLVVMHIRLAEKFGKSALFGFALFFLGFIFFPILAFGPATYEGEETFTFDEEE